jgi:hypothetical protein
MIDIPENTVGSILRAQAELIRELQAEIGRLRHENDMLKQKWDGKK